MKPTLRLLIFLLLASRLSWSAVELDLVTRTILNSPPSGRNSSSPELSADGRWLVFVSDSELLTTNLTRSVVLNIFLRDNESGRLRLVSRGVNGTAADGNSYAPVLSRDGTKLLFVSDAANLVTASHERFYLYDLVSGATTPLMLGDVPAIYTMTPDAQNILFESALPLSELDTNTVNDLYLFNVRSGTLELVSMNSSNTAATGPGRSESPFEASASDDGRYVAYVSGSLEVVPDVPLTPQPNLYVRDMVLKTNLLVTKDASGTIFRGYGNRLEGSTQSGISGDGRWLFFKSDVFLNSNPASYNNNSVYNYDVFSHSLTRLRAEYPKGAIEQLTFSANNKFLAFGQSDRLYVKDLRTDENRLVTSTDGLITNLAPTELIFSPNGRFLIFQSAAPVTSAESSDYQFYALDQETGRLRLVGGSTEGEKPNEPILSASVSDTGWVAFATFASNLGVVGDSRGSDVFVQNLLNDNAPITCVSVSREGPESVTPEGRTWLEPNSLSVDGRYVVFTSEAATFVLNDTNNTRDMFMYDALSKSNRVVTFTLDGQQRTNKSRLIGRNAEASVIAYFSREPDEQQESIFVFNAHSGRTTRESFLPSGDSTRVDSRAAISADGRFLAFSVGNQFFVRDLSEQRTQFATLVNSDDIVLFSSTGKYLVRIEVGSQIAVVDWKAGTTWFRQFDLFPVSTQISFSGNESQMTFFGPTRDSRNQGDDLYLFDPVEQNLTLASTNAVPPAALSWNGATLVFQAYDEGATNDAVRIHVRNLLTGETKTLPLADSISFRLRGESVMSDDARFVLLAAPDLSAPLAMGAREWYVYDTALDALNPLHQHTSGAETSLPASFAGTASLSADGRVVVFASLASDLVPLDLNLAPDIFLARISSVDANHNEIEDGWEILHPSASNPAADSDGDGMSNRTEYLAGTDPGDAASNLHITIAQEQSHGVLVMWNSARGKRYLLQTTTDAAAGQWQTFGELLIATADRSEARIPTPAGATRFYRISLSD